MFLGGDRAARRLRAHHPRTRQRIGDDASHTLNGVMTDSGPWDDPGLPEDQEAPDSRCRVNKPPHRFLRHTEGGSDPVAGGVQQTNASVMAPSEGPPPGGERTGPSRAPGGVRCLADRTKTRKAEKPWRSAISHTDQAGPATGRQIGEDGVHDSSRF